MNLVQKDRLKYVERLFSHFLETISNSEESVRYFKLFGTQKRLITYAGFIKNKMKLFNKTGLQNVPGSQCDYYTDPYTSICRRRNKLSDSV
jgi:hypothetical protein